MFSDQTAVLRALISPRVNEALRALSSFDDIFTNEVRSYAIGEVSEHLVMRLTGGIRTKRANRGYDIQLGSERIEVKARFVGKYRADDIHFNFGRHSGNADIGYCLLWEAKGEQDTELVFAIRAPMKHLAKLNGSLSAAKYYSRPTVRMLRAALAAALPECSTEG